MRVRHAGVAAASMRASSSATTASGSSFAKSGTGSRRVCPGGSALGSQRPVHDCVVAGEDDVLAAFAVVHRPELERPRDEPVVAEQLVQALRGERKERREEDLQAVDGAQGDVEDRRGAFTIGLEQRPRRLLRDVLVPEAGDPHDLLERVLEARGLDERPDRLEAALDLGEERLVGLGELARLGNRAEVLVRALECPVDEVPPRRDELVVVAPGELGPGEVRVLRLGAGDREEVAQRVRVVPAQEVAHEHLRPPARAELLALHREELARGDVVGQLEGATAGAVLAALAVSEQHARPDHGVEDDVVLPHEVRVLRVRVLPPLPPGVGRASHRRPLDRGGQVADDRVEPDVDPLVGVVLVARDGDRDAPVEVTGDRPRLQLLDEVEREPPDVLAPVLL